MFLSINLHYYEDYKHKTMQFLRIKLIFLRKLIVKS